MINQLFLDRDYSLNVCGFEGQFRLYFGSKFTELQLKILKSFPKQKRINYLFDDYFKIKEFELLYKHRDGY